MPTVADAYRKFQAELEQGRTHVAPREALEMIELALNRADLVGKGQVALERLDFPAEKEAAIAQMVQRRIAGEPLGQILGYAWFYGRRFSVTKDVLIPRPDTEVLVVEALARLKGAEHIAEVGVGTGCVMGTLLAEKPDVNAVGFEISDDAAAVARGNLQALGVDGRGRIEVRDGMDGVEESFNLLVSNPPYVTDDEWEMLEDEVRDHEPRLALTGGEPNPDGLLFYRRLAAWGSDKLRPDGWLCMETGWQQAQAVRELLQEQNRAAETAGKGKIWHAITVTKDLGGRERVVCAQRC
ncbi:MAG: peptide chain release factor N(5)-glutamine methyltransferase [Alphaproteobacteria bacterium]|nr:MAG: peptide chain release factor N(5)-glutamine methyltransferase [Alphaproteobacteria bacterium]